MINEADREAQEEAGIEMLMTLYGAKLDWQRIDDFYDTFGLKDKAARLP